jgi:hypothetical protein
MAGEATGGAASSRSRMIGRRAPELPQCRPRPRNGPPQTGPVPRSSRDARRRSQRPPTAAPRWHNKAVTSRPSARTWRRAAEQHRPPHRWKTRTPPVTVGTALAGNNRARSPAAARAGSPTRTYRPGSGGALATTCRPYRARRLAGWAGSPPFAGTRVKRGSFPGGRVLRWLHFACRGTPAHSGYPQSRCWTYTARRAREVPAHRKSPAPPLSAVCGRYSRPTRRPLRGAARGNSSCWS